MRGGKKNNADAKGDIDVNNDDNVDEDKNLIFKNPMYDNFLSAEKRDIQEKVDNNEKILEENLMTAIDAGNDDDIAKISKNLKKIRKEKTKLNKGKIKAQLDNNIRGVEMYVHAKPYPDYTWPWDVDDRKQNYVAKINYNILGRDDPYAKVDENLRQLKKYTINDALDDYTVSRDENGNIMYTEKNTINKKSPYSFNQYAKKDILFIPNKQNQKCKYRS